MDDIRKNLFGEIFSGLTRYEIDFLYPKETDIKKFLLSEDREEL